MITKYFLFKRELTYFIIVSILYILLLNQFLFNINVTGWTSDFYGHLYKIWKLMKDGYVEWTKDWHAGSTIFRFYPPLSYLIAAGIGKIFNSDIIGFKISVLLAMIIGAYGMRFLLKELKISEKVTYFVSVLYPIHPYIKYLTLSGAYPRFFGTMLVPLVIFFFIRMGKYRKIEDIIFASLVFSSLLLIHLSVAFTTALLAIGFIPYLILEKEISTKEFVRNFIFIILFCFLLSSFWIIPFFLEYEFSGIIDEAKYPDIFPFHSSKIEHLIDSNNPRYIGTFILSLSIIGFLIILFIEKNRNIKILSLILIILLVLNFILALGYYSPFPELNKLPLISKATPDRFLDNILFLSTIGVAFLIERILKINKKYLKYVFLGIISIFLAREISIFHRYINSNWIPFWAISEYNSLLEHFKNISKSEIKFIFQAGPELVMESYVAYAPTVLYNVLSLNGWYRQALHRVMDHITAVATIIHTYNLSERKDLRKYVERHLILQNVDCLSIHKKNKNYRLLSENLELISFKKEYETENFELWCWDKESFVNFEKDEKIEKVNYEILEYNDYRIKIKIFLEDNKEIVLASSYYPAWKAKLCKNIECADAIDISIDKNDVELIKLNIPAGTWILELEFADKWMPLRYFSLFSFSFLIIYLCIKKCLKK